jgi:hypothetical protein
MKKEPKWLSKKKLEITQMSNAELVEQVIVYSHTNGVDSGHDTPHKYADRFSTIFRLLYKELGDRMLVERFTVVPLKDYYDIPRPEADYY